MSLLKNIVDFEKGQKCKLLNCYEQKAIRVLQANDFRNEDKPQYTNVNIGVIAEKDDILVVWDGSIGQMGIGKTGFVGSTIVRLRVKDKKMYSPIFVYKYLQTKAEYLKRKATGATIQHINRKSLEQIEIPTIQYTDQLKIANILCHAENLIAQRKESIRLLDDYLKSTFIEMFGDPVKNEKKWIIKSIDEVCSEIVDCVNRTAPLVDYQTDYIMIRTTNVRNYKINFNESRFVNKETFEKWTRRLLPQRGDLIFTREAPAGEAALIDFDKQVFLGQRTMQFRANTKKVNPYYLLFQLMGPDLQRQIEKLSSGSTVKHLSVPACKKFQINVPPVELQNQFANIVEKTETLKFQYQSSLQELENLYHSLSQQAFKGELNAKDEEMLMAAESRVEYNTK